MDEQTRLSVKKLEQRLQQIEQATQQGILSTLQPSISIKLIRGQRGGYGWEIRVNGDLIEQVEKKLIQIDNDLKEIYGDRNGNP